MTGQEHLESICRKMFENIIVGNRAASSVELWHVLLKALMDVAQQSKDYCVARIADEEGRRN